jgi:hypothetical protein
VSPPDFAALRVLVQVRDGERPGTLTSLLARLERLWREGERRREQFNERDEERKCRHG